MLTGISSLCYPRFLFCWVLLFHFLACIPPKSIRSGRIVISGYEFLCECKYNTNPDLWVYPQGAEWEVASCLVSKRDIWRWAWMSQVTNLLSELSLWASVLSSLKWDITNLIVRVQRTKQVKHLYVCVLVTQLCLTLCNPLDCSPPGFSVHAIFQARVLEWVAMPSSRGSSWPKDQTQAFCICRQILYHCATWEALWEAHNSAHSFKTSLRSQAVRQLFVK